MINNLKFKEIITKYPPGISENEARLLFNLPKIIPKQGVIVEIGTYKGGSAILLAQGSKIAKKEKVYCVDHHKEGKTLGIFKKNIKKAKVNDFIISIVNKSEKAAKKWKKPISLLWIDGGHDYISVKKDFELWEKYLIKEGIIAFHDSKFSRKKLLSNGLPLGKMFGPRKIVENYILKSKRFKNIKVIDSITYAKKINNASLLEKIKIYFSFFPILFEIIDRNIGKVGLFLKEYHPKVYFKLKKITK